MRLFLLSLFVVATVKFSVAQIDPALTGKWKIVAFTTTDIMCDFKKDTIMFSKKFQDSLLKTGTDSTQLAMIMGYMQSMFSSIEYNVKADGSYEVSLGGKSEEAGTYVADKAKGTMTSTYKKPTGETVKEVINYTIKGNQLVLSKKDDPDMPNLKMTFEKAL